MTVYRLVPDVETLVLEVLTRQFGDLVRRAERAVARRRTARSRLVGVVAEVVRLLPAEPLFTRILELDPEVLLPFVTDRLGSTQQIALGHLRRLLAEGHADRSIRRGDAEAQAVAVLFAVSPLVLSARLLELTGNREGVVREVTQLLDRGLAP
jgi:AcrR family transcriptional regulator